MNPQINHLTTELEALLATRQEIALMAENAPERMRPAFHTAAANAGARVGEFIARQDVSESVALLEEQRNNDCEVILNLQSSGLLTEEQATTQLEDLFNHEDFTLLRYVMSIGSICLNESEVETVEVMVSPEVSPPVEQSAESDEVTKVISLATVEPTTEPKLETVEILKPKTSVKLTIIDGAGGKFLKVGNAKSTLKLSKATSKDQRNYSEERELVLKQLVDSNGEWVKIHDIQLKLEENGLKSDGETTGRIRDWLKSITYRRHPLIELSPGRRYAMYRTAVDYDVSLECKTFRAPLERKTTTKRVADQKKPTQNPNQLQEDISEGIIPLWESNLLSSILLEQPELLEVLNVPVIDANIVKMIDDASKAEDIKLGITRNSVNATALRSERLDVVKQFRAVFTHEETFDNMVANITEDDVLYPFIEYLLSFDDEQWDTVINQILNKKVSIKPISRDNSDGILEFITLPNGRKFRKITLNNGTATFNEVGVSKLTDAETAEDTGSEDIIQNSVSDSSKLVPSSDREEASVGKLKDKDPVWVKDLRTEIGIILQHLKETGQAHLFRGNVTAIQAQKIFGSNQVGSNNAMEKLISSGLIETQISTTGNRDSKRSWTVSLSQALMMKIIDSNPKLAGHSSKSAQKLAVQTIEKCALSFLESLK